VARVLETQHFDALDALLNPVELNLYLKLSYPKLSKQFREPWNCESVSQSPILQVLARLVANKQFDKTVEASIESDLEGHGF
jgi:hypothetical protein